MVCSTNFKKLHDLYQSEGVPKGVSIVHFCQMNGIVYKHYKRWYKNYHSAKIIPVEVVSRDVLSESSLPQALPVSTPVSASVIASFDVSFSNGLAPLNYLTRVFRQLMMGDKDYESLFPGKLALKTI